MAHEIINGKVVVDWTTGDPEGDRLTLLAAYRDFIKELYDFLVFPEDYDIQRIFYKWQVSTDGQIDNVPRIWIKRPE